MPRLRSATLTELAPSSSGEIHGPAYRHSACASQPIFTSSGSDFATSRAIRGAALRNSSACRLGHRFAAKDRGQDLERQEAFELDVRTPPEHAMSCKPAPRKSDREAGQLGSKAAWAVQAPIAARKVAGITARAVCGRPRMTRCMNPTRRWYELTVRCARTSVTMRRGPRQLGGFVA